MVWPVLARARLCFAGLVGAPLPPTHTHCCGAVQSADFGPKTALKIVDRVRDAIKAGKVKSGDDIRTALKVRGNTTYAQHSTAAPAVTGTAGSVARRRDRQAPWGRQAYSSPCTAPCTVACVDALPTAARGRMQACTAGSGGAEHSMPRGFMLFITYLCLCRPASSSWSLRRAAAPS